MTDWTGLKVGDTVYEVSDTQYSPSTVARYTVAAVSAKQFKTGKWHNHTVNLGAAAGWFRNSRDAIAETLRRNHIAIVSRENTIAEFREVVEVCEALLKEITP